jgi:hypothetical protein
MVVVNDLLPDQKLMVRCHLHVDTDLVVLGPEQKRQQDNAYEYDFFS